MKVTVLVENTAPENLQYEHGLSFLIEFHGNKYLLDAGTTDMFLENAKMLGISLDDVHTSILSHGHYDHSGGFGTFLEQNQDTKLFLMQGADNEFYSMSGELHEIGIPKEVIEMHRNRFQFIHEVTKLEEDIYLVPHATEGLETIGEKAKLYCKTGEEFLPDDFKHEMSVVFHTDKGLVVFNSCSHGGVKTIIEEVKTVFPDKSVYAFLGGLHMKGGIYSEEEIRLVAEYLKDVGVKYLYTGHCTGELPFQVLKTVAGDCVQALTTGKVIDI